MDVLGRPERTSHRAVAKTVVDSAIRCQGSVIVPGHPLPRLCNKLLVEEAGRPWRVRCSRCGHLNTSPPL